MLRTCEHTLEEIRGLESLSHIDAVGVAPADEVEQLPGCISLRDLVPSARSVVALLARMPAAAVERAGEPPAENGMSYSFIQYQLVRETLWAAQDLGRWFDRRGEASLPLADLSAQSHATLSPYGEGRRFGLPDLRANAPFAAAAGLGQLGLSGALLTPAYGPRQRFSFLLTTAELPPTRYEGPPLCRRCMRCVQVCPVAALSAEARETIVVGGRSFSCSARNEVRCRWARSLGMVPEEGPACLGWKDPGLPVPDLLGDDEVKRAIQHKDPLQVKAYRYPFQVDVIIEQCIKACPA